MDKEKILRKLKTKTRGVGKLLVVSWKDIEQVLNAQSKRECQTCGGSGKRAQLDCFRGVASIEPCPRCSGKGYLSQKDIENERQSGIVWLEETE